LKFPNGADGKMRNIVYETELEDSYHGCEISKNFNQHTSKWSVTVMLGLGW
jgi:hypothetical protein